MGLETVTFISDLVITNPVGATDPKSQGDDHLRNLKIGLKNTFPSITGAVTLSHTQLNDAALKSASNVFTAATNYLTHANPFLRWKESGASLNNKVWDLGAVSESFRGRLFDDAESASAIWLQVERNGTVVDSIGLSATTITLNGVASTDFARLSQSNTFVGSVTANAFNTANGLNITGATQGIEIGASGTSNTPYIDFHSGATGVDYDSRIMASGGSGSNGGGTLSITAATINLGGIAHTDFARLSQNNGFTGLQTITTAGAANSIQLINSGASITAILGVESANMAIGLSTNHGINVYTNNLLRFNITNGGNFDFKGGTVTRNNSSASEVGTAGAPGRNVGASGNTAATDAGGTIHLTSGSAQTFTLDSDPPVDSLVIIDNQSGNSWTIAASGTLTWAMTGGTGNRTLANNGMIAGLHLGSGNWKINGGGLS